MKILVFSDLHVKSNIKSSDIDQNRRLNQLDSAIKLICDFIIEDKPKYVVSLGDMVHYHQYIDSVSLHMLTGWLNSIKCACIEVGAQFKHILGNHDIFNNDGSIRSIEPFSVYCDIITKPTVETYGNTNLVFMPYMKLDAMHVYLYSMGSLLDSNTVIFSHTDILNAKYNTDFVAEHGIHVDEFGFATVFNGHHHLPTDLANKYCGEIHNVGTLCNLYSKDQYYKQPLRFMEMTIADDYDLYKSVESIHHQYSDYYVECSYSDPCKLLNILSDDIPAENINLSIIKDVESEDLDKLISNTKFASLVTHTESNKSKIIPRSSINSSMKTNDVIKTYINEKADKNNIDTELLYNIGLYLLK